MRTPLFLLGVGLALLSFIAMFAYGVLFANRSSGGPNVSVVVAARDIDTREPILPDMVAISTMPSSLVPPHSFLRASDLAGDSAVVPIYKGEAITSNVVSSNPDQLSPQASAYLPIPPGWIAITLPTNELQGVAGYPAVGDYLNIIASLNTSLFTPVDPHMVTQTVFTGVKIIRIGPVTNVPGQGQAQGVVSSLTVVMTQCDAQYIDWLITNATLKYELESFKDYSGAAMWPNPSCGAAASPEVIGRTAVDRLWGFTKD